MTAKYRSSRARTAPDRRSQSSLVPQAAAVGHHHVKNQVGVLGPLGHPEVMDGHLRLHGPCQGRHLFRRRFTDSSSVAMGSMCAVVSMPNFCWISRSMWSMASWASRMSASWGTSAWKEHSRRPGP